MKNKDPLKCNCIITMYLECDDHCCSIMYILAEHVDMTCPVPCQITLPLEPENHGYWWPICICSTLYMYAVWLIVKKALTMTGMRLSLIQVQVHNLIFMYMHFTVLFNVNLILCIIHNLKLLSISAYSVDTVCTLYMCILLCFVL